MGIIPDNPLGRAFCDLSGEANEILAATAEEVYVVFAGLPLKLK
jgi:adenosylcobinamide kinase/adenosylcobinamide-phosphate guanylyltransferase